MKSLILCYHKVGPVAEEGRFLNVEPATLASHVRFLRRRLRLVTVSEFVGAWPPEVAALTFDDAYESTLTFGLDVLRTEGAVATFYAVPGLVGKTSEWDGPRARPLADWDRLQLAQQAGFEIGNHTWSHPDMSLKSKGDQVAEWLRAQSAFRERGFDPVSACYPFGRLSAESEGALADSGITCGVALGKRWAEPRDTRTALPRIVIAYSDHLPKLIYKLYVRPRLP